jgi:dipeptidyl aminopeptidase/acylaminoacyl peptidase
VQARDGWPGFLPDGRRFLSRRTTPAEIATYVSALDGAAPRKIADGSFRIVVPAAGDRAAYLLGIGPAGAVAPPVDLNTVSASGTATTLVVGAVAVSASKTGILATSASGGLQRTIPTWFDRKGTSLGEIGKAGVVEGVALSPDARKLAATEQLAGKAPANTGAAPGAPPGAIWLRDLVSGTRTRVTFGGMDSTAVWSADGSTVAFTSRRDGVFLQYQRAANGAGDAIPLFAYAKNGRPEARRAVIAAFAAIGPQLQETDDDHPAVIITVGAKTSTEMSAQPA